MDRSREEREAECDEAKVREESGTNIEVDENLRIVWENVRKIRMREKQLELGKCMKMYDCRICALMKQDLIVLNTWKLLTCTDG